MTRPRSYKEIFAQRGSSYDKAMRLFPKARNKEFMELACRLPTASGFRVLDMPSGGGYLCPYFPPDIELIALDSCSTFINSNSRHKTIISDTHQLPFKHDSFDGLVSLAGLHHETNKGAIFEEMHRVLKAGAHFCIADVHVNSAVATFLDTVVDKYNSQGHQGLYLDGSTLDELDQAGLHVTNSEVVNFHWLFADQVQLVIFCRELFGLDKIEPDSFLQDTCTTLGIETLRNGIGLKWQLFYICGYAG